MGFVTRVKEDLGLPITSLTVRLSDIALGAPAAGVHLKVTAPDGHVLRGRTDESGRARVDDGLIPGRYSIVLEAGAWFGAHQRSCGYGEVIVDLDITAGAAHDVAITLAGYAYSVVLEPSAAASSAT